MRWVFNFSYCYYYNYYRYILIPYKNTTYKYQEIYNILEFWQHVAAVNSHHQCKIEHCVGTMKECTLWDPILFTIVGTLKFICWLILKEESLKSISEIYNTAFNMFKMKYSARVLYGDVVV